MVKTFGSLFSGIGGFDLGLERAGMVCKWQVENNDFCREVLEKHWPDVPKFGDVKEIKNLEWVDLICGGFPCQPVSVAGNRQGTNDARWLWPEFARIIRMVRPKYVLAENVPGLLTANNGGAFSEILGDLASLGYDAEWDCVSAESVGAPHLRWRVFIVAYDGSQRTPSVPTDDKDTSRRTIAGAESSWGGQDVANTRSERDRSDRGRPDRSVKDQRGRSTDTRGETLCTRAEVSLSSDSQKGSQNVADASQRQDLQRGGRDMDATSRRGQGGDSSVGPSSEDVADPDRNREERNQSEHGRRSGIEQDSQDMADAQKHDLRTGLRTEESGGQWSRRPSNNDWWSTEPDVGRVAHGVPSRVDRLKALGNAVVPQVAEFVGRRIMER